MAPPSPVRDERKEQLLAWQQQRTASPSRPDPQRRRSSQPSAMSPERPPDRPPSTTATYTQQFLRRRLSQQKLMGAQLQSPRANGNRRRRSSADGGDRCNGLQQLDANGNAPQAATTDVAVENQTAEDVVAGKGVAAEKSGAVNHVVNTEMKTKKRGALCSSTTVLVVTAGVVTVSVAGGVAICRMYPSSPAAISIRMVADRAKHVLYGLLVELQNQLGPYAVKLKEAVRAVLLVLAGNERLVMAGRAAQALVNEDMQAFSGFDNISAVMAVCMEKTRGQLGVVASGLTDILKLVVDWIQPHLMRLNSGANLEYLERFLLTVLFFFAETLKQCATWARLRMDEIFEWMGFESDLSDGKLPTDEFLAQLTTHQAAIQNIGRSLTARESRALADVKHSEKRRVAIASATNSIIADTRAIALDCVLDVKLAAMELMEERMKRLADQYAASIEHELEEYKHTSQQVQEEGVLGMLTEITSDNQPQVDAAESLKQELSFGEVTPNELSAETALSKEQIDTDVVQGEQANEEQAQSSMELPHEELLPAEQFKAPMTEEQDFSQDIPDSELSSKEATQATGTSTEDNIQHAELAEIAATEHSFYEDILISEDARDERIELTTGFTVAEHSIGQLSGTPEVESPNLPMDGGRGGQTQIIAELLEEKLQTSEVISSDEEKVVCGETKQTVVTEVLVELEDIVLEVEHTQEVSNLHASNLSEAGISEQDTMVQQEEQTVAHLAVPVDGVEMELVMELDSIAAVEKAETEQRRRGVNTRAAILSGSEVLEEERAEIHMKQAPESVQDVDYARTDQNELLAGDDDTNEKYKERQAKEAELIVETESTSVRVDGQVVGDPGIQVVSDQSGVFGVEEGVGLSFDGIESLDMERVAVEKEIHELAQLERVLLQEEEQVLLQEDEHIRVEEELRVIAQEEDIELQSEMHSFADEIFSTRSAHEDHTIEAKDVKATGELDGNRESGGWRPSLGLSLPRPALIISVAFLALALLAAYLLVRYRKRGLRARALRRRKRWQRLADMEDSDTEEVVLLPDDSSDDEDEENAGIPKESSLEETDELILSSKVETTVLRTSEGEEADVEEGTSEDHEDVYEETEEFGEDGGDAPSDSKPKPSRTVIVERSQRTTSTVDHPATPKLNASADDSDTASTPVSTPPSTSIQETPDTSQRARRRLRRALRT